MNDMKIRIVRESVNSNSITGSLYVNDKYICKTLELSYRNNEKGVSSIPEGNYGTVMRYDKSDGWRIQLTDTNPRTGVQIHKGNSPSDIKGCVLVGTAVDEKNNRITGSKDAYAKLKEAWGANDQCPVAVSVEIENKPKEEEKNADKDKDKDNKDKEKKEKEDKDKKEKEDKEKEDKEKADKEKKKKNGNTTMPAPDNGSDPCPTGHHAQNQPIVLVFPTLEEMLVLIEKHNAEAEGECGMKAPQNNQGSNNPEDTPPCPSTARPHFPIGLIPRVNPNEWGGCGTKDPLPPILKSGPIPFFRGSLMNDSDGFNNKKEDDPRNGRGSSPEPK